MVLGDGLVLLEGSEHAAHKRLMSPSFNKASIKSKTPSKVDLLSHGWWAFLESLGSVFNIPPACRKGVRTTHCLDSCS